MELTWAENWSRPDLCSKRASHVLWVQHIHLSFIVYLVFTILQQLMTKAGVTVFFTKTGGAKRWLSQWRKVPPALKGLLVQPKPAFLGLQIATSQTSEQNAASE